MNGYWKPRARLGFTLLLGVAGLAWAATLPRAAEEKETAAASGARPEPGETPDKGGPAEEPVKALVSGQVVLLAEAFRQKGIKSYGEEINNQVVLVTRKGALIPIVPDWRGRAFYQDERLRNRPVDLVVNRRPGVPWAQVLSIYTFDEKQSRQITDYWCDVCSIPMYEIKDCECCQGPTRLRFRPQAPPADLRSEE
ncbi:MAG: hypothetical protein ACKV0T_14925 [Planctomycetales bacterium]